MELYQLRTFLTVAEEGHLTRAAERLFTSQPAVSAQLRALEEELGIRLFERTAKGMVLTAEGQTLREHARRIVDAARDFKHSADNLREAPTGEFVLGINNRPEVLRLVPILQRLSLSHPGLTYHLVNDSSGILLQGIEEGTIAAGFFEGTYSSARLTQHPLDEIELTIVAPRIWEDELSQPDWKALEQKPWIFVSPHCSHYRAIEHICREQGLSLKHRFQVNEDMTVLGLVAEGLGLTVTSRYLAECSADADRLICLPHFQMKIPLSFGYLTSRAGDPAIRAVRDATLAEWSSRSTSSRRNTVLSRETFNASRS